MLIGKILKREDGISNELTGTKDQMVLENPLRHDIEADNELFADILQKAAKETVPRGKHENWVPLWKDRDLDELIKQIEEARKVLLNEPSEENHNIWNDEANKSMKRSMIAKPSI